MRSLSSSLLAAQRSASAVPYVEVQVYESIAGVTRVLWQRLYTGSEPDFYHAACIAGDGSLLRARVSPSDGHLYYQRVAAPGASSDYSLWTDLGAASDVSGVAMCSQGANVLLVSVGVDRRTITARDSSNNGQSFTASTIFVEAADVGWLAVAFSDGGTPAVFYSVGATVYVTKRASGVWSAPAAWSNSVAAITGLACCYAGDWDVVVTGRETGSSDYKVWTTVYGDGYLQAAGTWQALAEVATAEGGSGVQFQAPFLAKLDVFRQTFVEKYTGTSSYSRPFWSHSIASASYPGNLWREPVPFDAEGSYGLVLAADLSYAWATTPAGVWRAQLTPAPVVVTPDVIDLTVEDTVGAGRARIELRNDDGRYNVLGGVSNEAIKKGSEVRISPGYRTTSGAEVSAGPAYWIAGWEYLSQAGKASLVLYARDTWGLLEQWRARRQYTWTAGSKTVFQLLSFIFARAGLEFTTLSRSASLTGLTPAFTIHPGESGATAVQRLLKMAEDVIFFRGHTACLKYPQSSDHVDYSFGIDHPIREGHYLTAAQDSNRAQAYGSSLFAESFAWSELALVYDRLRQVRDLNLDTVGKAQDRADAELRRAEMAALGGYVAVPPNCGQELYDVVEITDSRAGLATAKRRVLGNTLRYSRLAKGGVYEQRLYLGAV
ncbi:MAG: hypothetical protein HY677_05710 [Chloroflexi bacterium]|nr:hypothetical protein [Chloroflexota bacterium]